MAKIKLMDEKTYSLIAAGEVVERPSSVVKELVENSIDAQAKSIKIYLKNSGIEEIVVIDDGEGMDKDDVLSSFLPHATSKIRNSFDLNRISTLGFRGEAIASIALVSIMTITASTNGTDGYFATYRFGSKIEEGSVAYNKGCKVVVQKLFINTPARLKYLASDKKELSSILYVVTKISLANPDIKFELYNDDKLIYQTLGNAKISDLVAQNYGLNAAKNILNTKINKDGYNLDIYFIKPEFYRSNKLEITTIVNKRFIKNYQMVNAFIDAFKTYLPISKYPIGLIYLTIDPLLIDVNIHPAKTEIKISIEDDIKKIIYDEVKKTLEEATHIPTRMINENEKFIKSSIFDFKDDENIFKPNSNNENPLKENNKIMDNNKPINIYNNLHEKTEDTNLDIKKDDYLKTNKIIAEEAIEAVIDRSTEGKKIPYMEYVGTVFATYLIFQNEDGMYLIDQHAAHERINYEHYRNLLSKDDQPTTELLVPLIIPFTKSEAIYIADNLDKFAKIGFELDQLDDNSFVIRSIPLWAKLDNLNDIIYDILALLIDKKEINIFKYRDEIAKQISCKSSIKANDYISREEIDNLINNLNKCTNPYTCPHGRPTIIRFTKEELEKMFERIQSKWKK